MKSWSDAKALENYLYINYAHLRPIFWLHNIHLVFSTYTNKWILSNEKLFLNATFEDFWCTKNK